VITGAALCPAPPLLARELTGLDPVVPELRSACAAAVERLSQGKPEVIVVAGAAASTGTWDAGSQLDLAAFAPAMARVGTRGLPLSLGLGALLLDQAGYQGRRILQAVGVHEPAGACLRLGARLRNSGERTALLAMGDGSARRSLKAPGYLDARAAAFDADVERAISEGDLDALQRVDHKLARDLMATGWPVWQVLSGAMHHLAPTTEVLYADDPFGVAYLVAYFTPRRAPLSGPSRHS
jgi:hypothetical protein